jgi:transposase
MLNQEILTSACPQSPFPLLATFGNIISSQQKELEELLRKNELLEKEIQEREQAHREEIQKKEQAYEQEIQKKEEEIKKKQDTILKIQKLLHGKKSEKSTSSKKGNKGSKGSKANQQGFNDDPEHELPPGSFPEHLERVEELIDDLPEGANPDDYYEFDEVVTERLAAFPGQFYVIVTRRKVYKHKETGKFHKPVAPEHPLGRCKVDLSFVISMILQKVLFHVPFYRFESVLKLSGIRIHRSNFVRWTTRFIELIKDIHAAIKKEVTSSSVVHVDETKIIANCKNSKESKKYHKTYIWNLVAPRTGVVFHWTRTRNNQETVALLKGVNGILVSDALNIYAHATEELGLVWQLCLIHVRRNFREITSCPAIAKEAQDKINLILFIDKKIRAQTRHNPKKRVHYRQRFLAPLFDNLKAWVTEQLILPEVQSDAALLKAFNYLNGRWVQVMTFLYYAEVYPTNNVAEQFFRYLKLGSKNWLFCASELGAKHLCILYTLVYSAKEVGINPLDYLTDIMTQIDERGVRAEDLTPKQWKKNREHLVNSQKKRKLKQPFV